MENLNKFWERSEKLGHSLNKNGIIQIAFLWPFTSSLIILLKFVLIISKLMMVCFQLMEGFKHT